MKLIHEATVLGLAKVMYESKMKKAGATAGLAGAAGAGAAGGYYGAKKLNKAYKNAKDSGQLDAAKEKIVGFFKKGGEAAKNVAQQSEERIDNW